MVYFIPKLSEDEKRKLFDAGYVPCPFCLEIMVDYYEANYCSGVILTNDDGTIDKHECGKPLHVGLKTPDHTRKYKPLTLQEIALKSLSVEDKARLFDDLVKTMNKPQD